MAAANVTLAWTGEGLEFDGGAAGGPSMHMDGNGKTAPSPMTVLLVAFGGCMGADVVDIATKSRAGMTGLDISIEAERATELPRRYTAITMRFTAHGVAPEDEPKLQRAIDMSREKYCSVLHSLRTDITMDFALVLA